MTPHVARKLARRLHADGVESVRIVEWLDDGEATILVQHNNAALESADAVDDYRRRHGLS